jgi:hypothetical protein
MTHRFLMVSQWSNALFRVLCNEPGPLAAMNAQIDGVGAGLILPTPRRRVDTGLKLTSRLDESVKELPLLNDAGRCLFNP